MNFLIFNPGLLLFEMPPRKPVIRTSNPSLKAKRKLIEI